MSGARRSRRSSRRTSPQQLGDVLREFEDTAEFKSLAQLDREIRIEHLLAYVKNAQREEYVAAEQSSGEWYRLLQSLDRLYTQRALDFCQMAKILRHITGQRQHLNIDARTDAEIERLFHKIDRGDQDSQSDSPFVNEHLARIFRAMQKTESEHQGWLSSRRKRTKRRTKKHASADVTSKKHVVESSSQEDVRVEDNQDDDGEDEQQTSVAVSQQKRRRVHVAPPKSAQRMPTADEVRKSRVYLLLKDKYDKQTMKLRLAEGDIRRLRNQVQVYTEKIYQLEKLSKEKEQNYESTIRNLKAQLRRVTNLLEKETANLEAVREEQRAQHRLLPPPAEPISAIGHGESSNNDDQYAREAKSAENASLVPQDGSVEPWQVDSNNYSASHFFHMKTEKAERRIFNHADEDDVQARSKWRMFTEHAKYPFIETVADPRPLMPWTTVVQEFLGDTTQNISRAIRCEGNFFVADELFVKLRRDTTVQFSYAALGEDLYGETNDEHTPLYQIRLACVSVDKETGEERPAQMPLKLTVRVNDERIYKVVEERNYSFLPLFGYDITSAVRRGENSVSFVLTPMHPINVKLGVQLVRIRDVVELSRTVGYLSEEQGIKWFRDNECNEKVLTVDGDGGSARKQTSSYVLSTTNSTKQVYTVNDAYTATPIDIPVRSKHCKHFQCFDMLTFLRVQVRNPDFRCPYCRVRFRLDELFVDDFFGRQIETCTSYGIQDFRLDTLGDAFAIQTVIEKPANDIGDEDDDTDK